MEEKKRAARTEAGLTSEFRDIKDGSKDPGIAYVRAPEINCRTLLRATRKQENFEELKKHEATYGEHKLGMERLHEREDCILRLGYKEEERPTMGAIKDRRKQEGIDYNMKTFGRVSIGVHGKELPKFYQSATQQWWKLHPTYSESPAHTSQLRMTQERKFWAKNDKVLLADVGEVEAPLDPFKETHVKMPPKNILPEKPNHIKHFRDTEESIKEPDLAHPRQHNYRWTTLENQ